MHSLIYRTGVYYLETNYLGTDLSWEMMSKCAFGNIWAYQKYFEFIFRLHEYWVWWATPPYSSNAATRCPFLRSPKPSVISWYHPTSPRSQFIKKIYHVFCLRRYTNTRWHSLGVYAAVYFPSSNIVDFYTLPTIFARFCLTLSTSTPALHLPWLRGHFCL